MPPTANHLRYPLRRRGHDRRLVRKTAGFQFGVNQFAVEMDLKATPCPRLKRQRVNGLLKLLKKQARQTESFWFVISHRAIFDMNFHLALSLRQIYGKGVITPLA